MWTVNRVRGFFVMCVQQDFIGYVQDINMAEGGLIITLCMILLLFCNYTCLLVTISYNIVHNWEYREKGVL